MRTIEKAFALVDTTLTGGVVANAFIAVAMGASMKRMWILLNTLQIVTHIPLLTLSLPSNLKVCLNTIISISSLSIIPKEWVEKGLKYINLASSKLNASVNSIEGYEPNSFSKNMGQVIIISIAIGAIIIMTICLFLLAKVSFL
jgi:hypothetical protein